jgi:hypothetical protein
MTDSGMSPDDIRRLIAARVPELDPADIADAFGVTAQPDPDSVPAEIVAEVLEVVDHLMNRMDRLEEAVAHAGEDVVEACRNVMVDLRLEQKDAVLNELALWVEAERGSHEQRH